MSARVRLLADIGGTNARFALQLPGRAPSRVRVLKTADYEGPAEAVAGYLETVPNAPAPAVAALALAAPITGDRVAFTNGRWAFSARALERALGLERLAVLNDFEALAWSLPGLRPRDLERIGGARAVRGFPRALFGPGTGLGVSCLVPDDPRRPGGPVALASEGGHATLAAGTAREAAVIERIAARFGHASAERALSGPGLVNLHRALAEIDGAPPPPSLLPGEIAARAQGRGDRHAREAVRMFSALAGAFAGDLALTFGARGGVFIGGGVIPRLGGAFDRRLFRRRFEAKGRYRAWLRPVAVDLILHPAPALAGLARFLDLMERPR